MFIAGKISISITEEHAAAVKEAVRSGAYASSSEVIREALREWRAKHFIAELWDEGAASGRCDDGTSMSDITQGGLVRAMALERGSAVA